MISPDSSHVLYLADQGNDRLYELYSVDLQGGAPVKLADCPVPELVVSFDISADIYSVPIGGGAVVKLGGPNHASDRLFVHLSADSSRAIYGADQDTAGVTEAYSVPIGGGTAVKLNDTLPAGKQVLWFQISPNSDRLVYSTGGVGGGAEPGMDELFSVPIGGGTMIHLTSGLIGAGTLHGFLFTPDGSQVIYQADQDDDGRDELYALDAQPLLLNGIGQLQRSLYLPVVGR